MFPNSKSGGGALTVKLNFKVAAAIKNRGTTTNASHGYVLPIRNGLPECDLHCPGIPVLLSGRVR